MTQKCCEICQSYHDAQERTVNYEYPCKCSWGEPDCDGCDNAKYNQAIKDILEKL